MMTFIPVCCITCNSTPRNTARRKLLFSLNSAQPLCLTCKLSRISSSSRFASALVSRRHAARVRHQQNGVWRQTNEAVWQEEDTNQQQNCRDDNHTQHPAPCTGVAEGGIRKISTEDPDSDHQLEASRSNARAIFSGARLRCTVVRYRGQPTASPSRTRERIVLQRLAQPQRTVNRQQTKLRRSSGSFCARV